MKNSILIFALFGFAFNLLSQSNEAFYTKQDLLRMPVEAAYYLNKKDDYKLSAFLDNTLKLKFDFQNSINNYSIYTQTLDGSWNYDKTITFFSLIVDKRVSDHRIHAMYLKTRGNESVTSKDFYDYLNNHPRAVKSEGAIFLLIGGLNMNNIESQKVIIGVVPDYFSNGLNYQVFFLKNDNTLPLKEILWGIYY